MAPFPRSLIWLTARQGTASRNSGVARYKVFEIRSKIRSNGFACDSGVYAFRSRVPARPGRLFYSGITCVPER